MQFKIDITRLLDVFNAECDIEDYSVTDNNELRVVYFDGDDRQTDIIPADEIAEWFDARFVRWMGYKDNPTALVVERG